MIGRVLAGALFAACAAWPVSAQTPAAPAPAERVYSPEELKADFAALYAGLKEAHYDLFVNTPKAEFDRLYAAQRASLTRPMTKAQAEIEFQTFVAHGKIAHARISAPDTYETYRAAGGPAFPIVLRIAGGRVYVGENLSGLAEVTEGDEIVNLNGRPIAHWLARATRHVSADTPYLAGSLLEYDFASLLWLDAGRIDAFDLELRTTQGKLLKVRVPARTRPEMKAAEAARPKSAVIAGDVREARVLPGGVGYLHPGPFYNFEAGANMWDAKDFVAFIDRSFQSFLDAKVDRLIIDLRDNPGGDNSFSDPMISWFADRPFRFFKTFNVKVSPQTVASNQARLDAAPAGADAASKNLADLYAKARPGGVASLDLPWAYPREGKRFTGKVYLLVNRRSYSNTVNVAALVQDYGFGKVLGEETSDMATTYGAMEQFKLPVTGIMVGYPKAHIVRPNGELKPRGVVPDVAIASPIVEGDRDVVLEKAIAYVAGA
jgi:C-terminal processing protease CtpA/Prc